MTDSQSRWPEAEGSNAARDPYRRIGVRPVINCAGVRTIHGNSVPLPEVRAAMDEAARDIVLLDELMAAVGGRLAELTGAEWGIVTAGSAAALCVAAAGAIAGNDPEKMLALPDARGLRNRILVPAGQRFVYDHAMRLAGGTIVEVADVAALEAALARGDVALISVLGAKDDASSLRLEQIVPAARAHGIPVLVDAASEFPVHPDPWLGRGADLVVYSSGKYLRGPSATGLLLGRRALVEAAWANASPHQAVGRPIKVGREQIIGALVAVERWFARDPAAAERQWEHDLAAIAGPLSRIAGVSCERLPRSRTHVPRLRLRWARDAIGLTGLALRARLLAGEPRILVDDIGASDDSILIDPFGLHDGEAAIVAATLQRHLEAARVSAAAPSAPPGAQAFHSLSGGWTVAVSFLHGSGDHAFRIEQQGARLSGEHAVAGFAAALEGEIDGNRVALRSSHPREGVAVTYTFAGTLAGPGAAETMSGAFVAGCNGDGNQGPVADSQFGSGTWTARRSDAAAR